MDLAPLITSTLVSCAVCAFGNSPKPRGKPPLVQPVLPWPTGTGNPREILHETILFAAWVKSWRFSPLNWNEGPKQKDKQRVVDFAKEVSDHDIEKMVLGLMNAASGQVDLNHVWSRDGYDGPSDQQWVAGVNLIFSEALRARAGGVMPLLAPGLEHEPSRTLILDSCAESGSPGVMPWVCPFTRRWRELSRRSRADLLNSIGGFRWEALSPEEQELSRDGLRYLWDHRAELDLASLETVTEYLGFIPKSGD